MARARRRSAPGPDLTALETLDVDALEARLGSARLATALEGARRFGRGE
jgi:hypothetical protein